MRLLSLLFSVGVLGHKKCKRVSNSQPSSDDDDPSSSVPELIKSPLPYTYIEAESLPKTFDWRNVSGVSYVTQDLNQHIPQYCGSCWLHGSIASLNDRLKIARKAQFPEINLARQVVLNCGNSTAGSCEGGGDYGMYVFVNKFGLPDDTCQLYSAEEFACSAFRNCMNCDPPTDQAPLGVCYPVQSYARYFVSEFGKMNNPTIHEMKAEIFQRGPISCSIDCSTLTHGQFVPGEIVRTAHPAVGDWDLDHVISVAGWGLDDHTGEEYWIVRNSWGTFWGDNGWFKVLLGHNTLGIEMECNWAAMDPHGHRANYGPSDVDREFSSAWMDPKAKEERNAAEFFRFVENPREVIPSEVKAKLPELAIENQIL